MRDSLAPLFVASLLGACGDAKVPEEQIVADDPAERPASTCGDTGFLQASLSGALNAEIDWTDETLTCESMRRPDDRGVRLRLSGEVRGERLAFIIALPELHAGQTGADIDSIVTLTVEGSGRFFSTPNLGSCWADIDTNLPLAEADGLHIVAGSVDCVAPLGEFNGVAYVEARDLRFSGVGDWNAS